ncbi:sterol regulatory element binding protein cleavage-activating protein [Cristinia sonorae]|uniref:Sterol regulatory element-binding protein cleavage-activating protein n=1 Tax=Cristinia sonorae TaxID=1940300 RepID=A0A8K0XPN4_9AGAR|nr:sterol regulatory element binding protein cleavage-activating protein [Cristinia sonorae]
MLDSFLRPVRAYGSRFFHRFGIHCATHQIRVLLISSVVISALLFPAIAIYFSNDTQIFALTLRALDSFLTPDDVSSWLAHGDLRDFWEGFGDLGVREDSMARARCGREGILRSERVLIHNMQDEDAGSLTRETLLYALKLEQRIAQVLPKHDVRCLRGHDRRCFSLSPLAFWHHDESVLLSDPNILDTLKHPKNVSVSGVTVTPEMVLAGRESNDTESDDTDMAMFLVLTYLFPDSDCLRNHAHLKWMYALEEAVGSSGDLLMQAQVPQLVALEYPKNSTSANRRSVLSLFSYAAYLAFLVYFVRSTRRMDTVHSRIGLVFTGLVEIVVSTLTSLSVCAIVGFRVTMVPWEIFPIIVIFIGVENMFSIIDAVVHTSVALPVKMRIAEGLSRAGTSNTLKLISYNTVLGVIAFFSVGAIRQFCAFAIVVLVAHWFLIHTFFVTVLSIDIQRLELDELLRQGTGLTPTTAAPGLGVPPKSAKSKLARTAHVFNGRVLKNLSLFLLLAITAALYFATYPASTAHKHKHEHRLGLHRPKARGSNRPVTQDNVSPAFNMWQVLNPSGHDLVHVRVESPALLMVYDNAEFHDEDLSHPDEGNKPTQWTRSPWSVWSRNMRPLVWITKIVLVPIVVTTAMLYGLLLYLLKDADLLEAQRNRAESDAEEPEEVIPPVEGQISFSTLPRAFITDVDLVAASKDGDTIVSISLQNEFALWKTQTKLWTKIDTSDILLGNGASAPSATATLTAIAIDEGGTYCAVGTGGGVIALWAIAGDKVKPLPHLFTETTVSGVTGIQFSPSDESGQATPRRSAPSLIGIPNALYATYENGAVIKWTMASLAVPVYITPSRSASISKSFLIPNEGDCGVLVAFALDDGALDIRDIDRPDGLIHGGCIIPAGNPMDVVSAVHVCAVELESEQHLIIGAATQAGVVSVWDGNSAECLHIMEEPFGDISRLRLTSGSVRTCPTCGELPYDNFTISFSTGQAVLFYRAYLSVPTRRCSCVHNQPSHQLRSSILGRRSRSSSAASNTNGTVTPSNPNQRSRLSSFSSTSSSLETPMFPISGHGVHSRRTSDKDSLRRNLDTFLATEHDDSELPSPIGPQEPTNNNFLSSESRSPLWQSLVVARIGDATCERGGWEVANGRIVGIRRKPRIPLPNGRTEGAATSTTSTIVQLTNRSSAGLSSSALERWELWTFNPYDSRLEASPLIALRLSDASDSTSSPSPSPAKVPPKLNTGHSSSVSSSTTTGTAARHIPQTRPSPKALPLTNAIPRLHFTRVSPFIGDRTFCAAGFGNTIGMFRFSPSASPSSGSSFLMPPR